MKKIKFLVIFLIILLCLTKASFCNPDINFSKTFAVITGVLTWEDKDFTSFSKENRKDKELYDLFLKLGIPQQNMTLLLDEKATLNNMQNAIKETAKNAEEDSVFIFYYAGHGTRNPTTGNAYFANYDIKGNSIETTGFDVSKIHEIIKDNFKGKLVILMADCCYSGNLCTEAKELYESGFNAISLTASSSSNTSTENWTFTQTVIDCLSGDPFADRNLDGKITITETGLEISDAMKNRERQFYGYFAPPLFENMVIADATFDGNYKYGDPAGVYSKGAYIYGLYNNRWECSRVLDYNNGKYQVQYYFYCNKKDELIKEKDTKTITFVTFPENEDCIILYDEVEYKAKILKVENGFQYVTYPGWPSFWDEWVPYERIISLKNSKDKIKKAEVEDKGDWYPAVILKEEQGKYFIHYLDYNCSWDEWVTPERIKLN